MGQGGRRVSGVNARKKGAADRGSAVSSWEQFGPLHQYPGAARTHNLADISLDIPREQADRRYGGLTGQGKSSFGFSTPSMPEGQRRYVQSLSTYARLFLAADGAAGRRCDFRYSAGGSRPAAGKNNNQEWRARRFGTVTEISDYLRLLYATVGADDLPAAAAAKVSRDSVRERPAVKILTEPGLYICAGAVRGGARARCSTAANYLIQNGYHRLFDNGAITETAEFAARAGAGGRAFPKPR